MTTQEGGMAVIFWGPHSVSSEQFARRLNAPCYLIHYLGWKRPWMAPFKYPPMWIKTWWILLKQRPSAVLVINTPVFAPVCVYLYCLFARIPFAMNVHGHTLSGRKWGWSRPLQRFLARRAAANLIGTSEYQRTLEGWGARVFFLEEPPIEAAPSRSQVLVRSREFRVTIVSTFAADEPVKLVVEAARRLPEVCFFMLGDTKLAKKELLNSAPRNVIFTGYLKGSDYWDQLYSSDAILTLTTNPHSLVAGGTEGMCVGKPLILSRQPALTEYFTKGTVFVDHTAESIVDAVQQVREQKDMLAQQSAELAAEKYVAWESSFQEFAKILGASRE